MVNHEDSKQNDYALSIVRQHCVDVLSSVRFVAAKVILEDDLQQSWELVACSGCLAWRGHKFEKAAQVRACPQEVGAEHPRGGGLGAQYTRTPVWVRKEFEKDHGPAVNGKPGEKKSRFRRTKHTWELGGSREQCRKAQRDHSGFQKCNNLQWRTLQNNA